MNKRSFLFLAIFALVGAVVPGEVVGMKKIFGSFSRKKDKTGVDFTGYVKPKDGFGIVSGDYSDFDLGEEPWKNRYSMTEKKIDRIKESWNKSGDTRKDEAPEITGYAEFDGEGRACISYCDDNDEKTFDDENPFAESIASSRRKNRNLSLLGRALSEFATFRDLSQLNNYNDVAKKIITDVFGYDGRHVKNVKCNFSQGNITFTYLNENETIDFCGTDGESIVRLEACNNEMLEPVDINGYLESCDEIVDINGYNQSTQSDSDA